MKYPDSTQKILQYFKYLTTQPVFLSQNFFRSLTCPPSCGACCSAFTLDWFPTDIEAGNFPKTDMEVTEREVAGNLGNVKVRSIMPTKEQSLCVFVAEDGSCSIHDQHPLSCRVEPIKFKSIKDVTYIARQDFSRGWNMTQVSGEKGTLCKFDQYNLEQWDTDMELFAGLIAVGRLFGYRLEAIIKLQSVLSRYKERLIGGFIPSRKLRLV